MAQRAKDAPSGLEMPLLPVRGIREGRVSSSVSNENELR
jgi:hypothetical protein